MADQIPPVSGAPGDAEWYRWAEGNIVSLLRERDRSSLEADAANAGLGASVASLSNQIRDLQGRVAYAVGEENAGTYWTSTQSSNLDWGAPLTFTLESDRIVSIEFAVQAQVYGAASGSGANVSANIGAGLKIDGAPVNGFAFGYLGVNVSFPAGGTTVVSDSSVATLRASAVLTLAAGTHTIRGSLSSRSVGIVGSGSASLFAGSSQLTVNVLQPAGA